MYLCARTKPRVLTKRHFNPTIRSSTANLNYNGNLLLPSYTLCETILVLLTAEQGRLLHSPLCRALITANFHMPRACIACNQPLLIPHCSTANRVSSCFAAVYFLMTHSRHMSSRKGFSWVSNWLYIRSLAK